MKRKEANVFQVLGIAITLIAIGVVPASIRASGLLARCHHCGKECETHVMVEKTIMVATKVLETRVQSYMVQSMEEREEKYTAFKLVPDNRDIKKECCYLEDEVKSKIITEKHCKLVDVPVTILQKIKVPEYETVERVRTKEVCTECGPKCIHEVCLEEIARMHDDIRVDEDCKKVLVFEELKKEIFYCVKTPKKYTLTCSTEESFKLEPVEKTRKVQVCVPKFEKRPVEVEVVKMLPKKVMCCVKCK